MQRNLWPGTVIDSPRVGRGERVASEKKKRRAGRKGREKREQQQQQRQRALLGRTPTGLFQYYARWQVSLCPEWHVISVTSSRFDQVIEFSFSTWPRKIGCRDTPTNPRPGRRGRFSTPWNTCRRGSLILLSPNERALFDFFIPPPRMFPLFDFVPRDRRSSTDELSERMKFHFRVRRESRIAAKLRYNKSNKKCVITRIDFGKKQCEMRRASTLYLSRNKREETQTVELRRRWNETMEADGVWWIRPPWPL